MGKVSNRHWSHVYVRAPDVKILVWVGADGDGDTTVVWFTCVDQTDSL